MPTYIYTMFRRSLFASALAALAIASCTEPASKDPTTKRVGCDLGLPGPSMVEIPHPGGTFCIDSTEVTQKQYEVFIKDSFVKMNIDVPLGDTKWEQPGECAISNGGLYYPYRWDGCSGVYRPELTPDEPVRCMDWCDAYAYCNWAGKRLCGKIGSGHLLTRDEYADPSKSMFYYACSQGGTSEFGTGDVPVEQVCNVEIETAGKSSPACHGDKPPYDGVYGLNDSVMEFIDATEDGVNAAAFYPFRTGDPLDSSAPTPCGQLGTASRSDVNPTFGFRCCLN